MYLAVCSAAIGFLLLSVLDSNIETSHFTAQFQDYGKPAFVLLRRQVCQKRKTRLFI
jgi:hypothetical protein